MVIAPFRIRWRSPGAFYRLMIKITSDKQREANRLNAKKSTGPKTARGKARVSRNALKHGLLAKDVVVEGLQGSESQADFDALLADFCRELRPNGLIEETLVERIATCYWRLRRAQRFEAGAIRGSLESPDPAEEALEKHRKKLDNAILDLNQELRLGKLLEKPADRLSPQETQECEQQVNDFARAHGLTLRNLDAQALKDAVKTELPQVISALCEKVARLRAEFDTAQRREHANTEKRRTAAFLPEGDGLLKVVRYETMLDRQIHRALAELRRRRVPMRVTRKNNTCQTNPFDAPA